MFGGGIAAVLDDFRLLEVYRGGKRRAWKSAQDKGHRRRAGAVPGTRSRRGAARRSTRTSRRPGSRWRWPSPRGRGTGRAVERDRRSSTRPRPDAHAGGRPATGAATTPTTRLNSPLAPYLTLGTRLGRRVLTQAVKLSPLNLRPALRIPPAWNAKAIALVASGYARLWAARGDEEARDQAERWLRWLIENSSAPVGLGWGYHFDVQTRFFAYPRRDAERDRDELCRARAARRLRAASDDEEWGDGALQSCEFLVARLLEDDHAALVLPLPPRRARARSQRQRARLLRARA